LKNSFAALRITFPQAAFNNSRTRHPLDGEQNVPNTSPAPVLKGYLTMLSFGCKTNGFTGQLRDRLQTTGMALGLVRLQMDVGLTKEARTTLASLQDDFQLLLRGVDSSTETQPITSCAGMNAERSFGKRDSWDLNEELLPAHDWGI
jgi:hypothetical protein